MNATQLRACHGSLAYESCRRLSVNATSLIVVSLALGVPGRSSGAAAALDRPPAADEVAYRPEDGSSVAANPPAFVWLPAQGVARWILQYSTSEDFSADASTTVEDIDMTVHIPGETLAPGTWYWRYGHAGSGGPVFSRVRRFTIPDNAVVFPYPGAGTFLARVPRTRPRAYFTPELVAEIRANRDQFAWLVDPVVDRAEAVLDQKEPLFPEPKPWDEYENWREVYNATWRAMRPYTAGMEICARAYLFTGDRRFAAEARRRLMHFMTWDVDGPSSVYWPTELGMDIGENAPRTFDYTLKVLWSTYPAWSSSAPVPFHRHHGRANRRRANRGRSDAVPPRSGGGVARTDRVDRSRRGNGGARGR
jgi:hypothetical protein